MNDEDDIELLSSGDKGQSGEKLTYGKNKAFPQWNCGTRSVIPLMLFEELDITIRYTLFIAAFTGLYLYDTEWSKANLPLIYIGLNIVTMFSRIPFLGGYVSYSISFIMGSLVSIAIVILLTYIVGHSSDPVTYLQPTGNFTCIYSPLTETYTAIPITFPVIGDLGDPNTVLLAFLLFIGTFLLTHFGRSVVWVKGAVITLNLYTAIWYLGNVDQTVPIADNLQFLKYLRTTVIGIGFFLVCLLIPLPKLFPTFLPQPRVSTTTILVGLGKCQADYANICSELIDHYRRLIIDQNAENKHYSDKKKRRYADHMSYQHIASVPLSSKLFMKEKLEEITETILKLRFLYKESGRWEAFWWTLPFPHCIGGKSINRFLSEFKVAVFHAKMMVRALDDIHYRTDNDVTITPENAEQIDRIMTNSDRFIQKSFNVSQNFERCCSRGNALGCCYFGDTDDQEYNELCSDIESLLQEQKDFSVENILDLIPEDHNTSEKTKLTSNLPTQFPRLFFVLNYLAIIKLTKSLELLCRNMTMANRRKAESEPVSKKKAIPVSIFTHVIEYPIRVLEWFTKYVRDILKDIKYFLSLVTLRHENPLSKIYIYSLFQSRKILSSFIISVAISIAFLFVFIEYFRTRVPSSITIIITIVTAVEPENPGTAITRSMFRLAGTSVGIASSFILLALSDNDKNSVYAASIIFAFVGRFLIGKEKFSDFATSFLTTSWIVFYSGTIDLPPNLLLASIAARGIAVGIGIVIAFGALFLWPINPSLQLKYNTLKLLCSNSTKTMKKILDPPSGAPISQSKFYKNWLRKIDKRMKDIVLQYELAIESREELHIFTNFNFPSNDFNQFINLEKRLYGDILWLDIILYSLKRGDTRLNELGEEFAQAKLRLFSVLRFCIEEIGKKVYSDTVSPFLVHYHLKRAFYEHSDQIRHHIGILSGNGVQNLQIIQFHSLIYTFALLIDTINKLDRKAERISAFNRARKPAGIPLCF